MKWLFAFPLLVCTHAWADPPCGVDITMTKAKLTVAGKVIARKDGKIDKAALGAELAARHAEQTESCAAKARLAADDAVSYGDVVDVMDAAIHAGFTDVQLQAAPAQRR
jgi:biopolymer transport protein ExbD